eukprot:Pompholyxophrys_punicea_v1_NODE_982_length_1071_cov_37.705709.p2 type:complete len:107 gc:universal NODE_982_length_1071_cov_37.705709:333-13(-)
MELTEILKASGVEPVSGVNRKVFLSIRVCLAATKNSFTKKYLPATLEQQTVTDFPKLSSFHRLGMWNGVEWTSSIGLLSENQSISFFGQQKSSNIRITGEVVLQII